MVAQGSGRGGAPPLPETETAAVATLRSDLGRVVSESAGRYGLLVVSLDRGDTLVSLAPDLPLAPASNLKLFTTAAALHFLGPEFRFATYLVADGTVRDDGVLAGDLLLYGTGDPAISDRLLPSAASVWDALADSLFSAGIRRITGALIADASHWDDQRIAVGWLERDLSQSYAPRSSALGQGEGLRGGRPVSDPARFAAEGMREALRRRGIGVGGTEVVRSAQASRVSFGSVGPGLQSAVGELRIIATHLSPPLGELVRVTNQVSHNGFADALLKALGRTVGGEGSFAAGAVVVKRFLHHEAGIDTAGVRIEDGSGLSRLNRVPARAAVALLARMATHRHRDRWWASLPEAGRARSGGGLPRMWGTAAARNLRAKTGTVGGVSALSGYVRAANGECLAFSILSNGVPSTGAAKAREDRIGARLAAFWR